MKHAAPAFRLLLALTFLTGLVYPFAMTGLSRILFADQAEGSLIKREGVIRGSRLIGQRFSEPHYFWSRPSAVEYNPLPSGGSNLGPTSRKLQEEVEERRKRFALGPNNLVPKDLLFASGSGLDPDISPEAARYQMARVAAAREWTDEESVARLAKLIDAHTELKQLGFLGEDRVNVLSLNLALDEIEAANEVKPDER